MLRSSSRLTSRGIIADARIIGRQGKALDTNGGKRNCTTSSMLQCTIQQFNRKIKIRSLPTMMDRC
jgi:hypothetical protein